MRRILKSYVTLFWSLFGLTQLSAVREGRTQPFTKTVGEYMLMVYHAMAVIVLINMLIAMMSNSFQEIEVTFLRGPAPWPRSLRIPSGFRCGAVIVRCLPVW